MLVLMRLDIKDTGNPLSGHVVELESDEAHQLLVAVIGPRKTSTSGPVAVIHLNGGQRKAYNRALHRFRSISQRYCEAGGFISQPAAYTRDRQRDVIGMMADVGRDIWEIFQDLKHPVRDWIDALLKSSGRAMQPVTVLTNDFAIPWFWLKEKVADPFLCEVCSLGMLHFSPTPRAGDSSGLAAGRHETYDALLINGFSDLPYVKREMEIVKTFLEEPSRGPNYSFKAHYADTSREISSLRDEYEDQLRTKFRIVHFCGKYSSDTLWVKGKELSDSLLKDVSHRSLLVLDGYRDECGSSGWPDVASVTSALVNQGGALGCVVPVLPVKDDPVVAKILWGKLYQDLRRPASTIGQALVNARRALKEQFEDNPAWAAYQLIGSPAGQLCSEDNEETAV
jgi:hypothetical protein